MKPGKLVKTFQSKSGKEIILRYPRHDDVDDLLEYVNELSAENTFLQYSGKKISRDEEEAYISGVLKDLKNKNQVMLLAYHGDTLIGSTRIRRKADHKRSLHVATMNISVRYGYREEGIGTALMNEVLKEVKNLPGLKIITLTVFGNNDRAQALYASMGFKQFGILPDGIRYKGEYHDYVYMYKRLD